MPGGIAAAAGTPGSRIGNLQCRPGSTVNVVCRYSDHIDLFTTASDGRIMSTWWDARTGWASWFQVQGGVAAAGATVTAIARYPFHLDLFTVGTDNRVYSCWWDERSGWHNWFPIGNLQCRPDSTVTSWLASPTSSICSPPLRTAGSCPPGGTRGAGWGNWFQVSGGVASPGSPVTAIARYSNHLDLFVIGTDNRIYSTWWHEGHELGRLVQRVGRCRQAGRTGGSDLSVHRAHRPVHRRLGRPGLQHLVGRRDRLGGLVRTRRDLTDSDRPHVIVTRGAAQRPPVPWHRQSNRNPGHS